MKLLLKALSIALVPVSFTLFSCGGNKGKENKTAPEKVQTAFKQKFPTATDVEWEKENDTEWEAEFKMDGKEYSANFKSEGEWLETEYEINSADLSQNIKTNIDSVFAGYKIEKAEITETKDGKQFEIQLKKEETTVEAFYLEDGTLVKQDKENEEKNEDKEGDKDEDKD